MQWRYIESHWDIFKVIAQQHWSEVSYQQFETVAGKRARLSQVIQGTYGVSRFEAEHQLSDWQDSKINIDGQFHTAPLVKD
ncbi:MAG: hypothetical protein Q7V02_07465 [Methylophilus sp.]|nr:hypothetical protein [Methylophilus sp.]